MLCSNAASGVGTEHYDTIAGMRKCQLELLDVLRAEIADLYRLRGEDDVRLRRLEERLARHSACPGPTPSATPPANSMPTDPR